ncbi:MAG: hypothetical protein JNJ54_21315 [Myxococcaceae bacterium]|nr:hypothetical protein [Myxococcaceae bacterium]
MPQTLRAPWVPFVIGALAFTTLVGALTGALNLWSLHVLQEGVPVAHHQAHALAQVFGFMWLLKVGISFHLAPRLLGGRPPGRTVVSVVAVTGLAGVLLLVLGRLGGMLPGSGWLGLLGAVLLLLSMVTWARFFWSLYRRRQELGDWLPEFVTAGATWWAVSAAALFVWQVGQTLGGPLLAVPFELVTWSGLLGGASSCIFGITLRAGACVMQVERSQASRQRVGFFVWQAATALVLVKALWPFAAWSDALWLAPASALLVMVWVIRPFGGLRLNLTWDEPLVRFAMVASWGFAVVAAVLFGWRALAVVGLTPPPLLADASRHAFTLGFAQLGVFAFAGRMVPGFEGVRLPARGLFDAGVLALTAATALRLASLFAPLRPALVASGVSGPLALVGVALLSWCLFKVLRGGAVLRRELEQSRARIQVHVVRA